MIISALIHIIYDDNVLSNNSLNDVWLGVKTCMVDIENQKVVVTGNFDEEKLLKKLKKKMNKRIKDVEKENKDEEPETILKKDEGAKIATENYEESEMDRNIYIQQNRDDEKEMARWMMFSDENPNACCLS